MVAIALLALGTLRLAPEVRTFPEIAALVGETPTEVRCDPTIAHRAAFASARSISREGLLRALDLVIVEDGKRKLLKNANAKRDREWATGMRNALARRYERTMRAGLAAADAGTPDPARGDWAAPFAAILTDRTTTPEQRRRADDAYLVAAGEALLRREEPGTEATLRALAAFPSDVPDELLERGVVTDTLPLAAMSPRTLGILRGVYPDLKGGPDAIVVRRRTLLLGAWPILGMNAGIGLVDPGVIVGPNMIATISALPFGPETGAVPLLVWANGEGTVRLPGFTEAMTAWRAEEEKGRERIATILAKLPPPNPATTAALSGVAELWAANGHDVILELSPASEPLGDVLDGPRWRTGASWSPRVVEGVLVLRPSLGFLTSRRRYPLAALAAMERTGARGEPLTAPDRLPSDALAAYLRALAPDARWGATDYRGWTGEFLDLDASRARLDRFVSSALRTWSDRRLTELRRGSRESENPKPSEIPLTELPPATQAEIANEMRATSYGGINAGRYAPATNLLAFSPAAMRLFLARGTLRVGFATIRDRWERTVTIRSEVPLFNPSGLDPGSPGDVAGLSNEP